MQKSVLRYWKIFAILKNCYQNYQTDEIQKYKSGNPSENIKSENWLIVLRPHVGNPWDKRFVIKILIMESIISYLIWAELADLFRIFRIVERFAFLLVRRLFVHGQGGQVREEKGAGVALLPDARHLILVWKDEVVITSTNLVILIMTNGSEFLFLF